MHFHLRKARAIPRAGFYLFIYLNGKVKAVTEALLKKTWEGD